MREIERRLRRLEESGPPEQNRFFVISDRPIDDVSEINVEDQPYSYVNGNKVVYLINDGPPLSAKEWAKHHCTPD